MFIDEAKISVRAGKGGDGMVSFHTAKYVPNGGPDGGDGGRGGSVIFLADPGMNTLQNFRYKRRFHADDGQNGGRKKMSGSSGNDLVIKVPVGTMVKDLESGQTLADLTEAGQEVVIAHGGRGGKGNVHFANPIRQAPNFARAGEPGEAYELKVELKLLADVGLIGYPNVGKSTLLSVISAARPKIADYPFTTLEPNLGVVAVDDYSFVVADIPGLIEGASEGLGLGHDFLRHVERTRLLIHVVDASGAEGRDPIADFEQINHELAEFNELLASRPQLVALNKIDDTEPAELDRLSKILRERGYEVFPICAPIHEGVDALVKKAAQLVRTLPPTILTEPVSEEMLYRFEEKELFAVERDGSTYVVTGDWIENLVGSTNFDDPESLQYFQRLLRKKGVIAALEAAGVQEGDPVRLHDADFEFLF